MGFSPGQRTPPQTPLDCLNKAWAQKELRSHGNILRLESAAGNRAGREDYGYDLDAALSAVVAIRTVVPADAFTADILGTERTGNGVIIRPDGLVLTIGYLVTEATEVWMTLGDGRTIRGDVIGYDQDTGFGLIQALGRVMLPALSLGDSTDAVPGTRVVAAGAGGREHSVAARVIARQEVRRLLGIPRRRGDLHRAGAIPTGAARR